MAKHKYYNFADILKDENAAGLQGKKENIDYYSLMRVNRIYGKTIEPDNSTKLEALMHYH